jgi:N-acetylglutamate synthase-like GNAT family acetyltransferase
MEEIRPAKISELEKIHALISEGAKAGMLLKRTKKELKELIKQKNVFVAETNSELAGITILDYYSKRLSELRSLYTKPEHRGKGLGTKLMQAIFTRAKELKVKELMTITMKENCSWFKKHGFKEETHHFKIALFKKIE